MQLLRSFVKFVIFKSFLWLLRSFVRYLRQISGFLQSFRSFVKFVREVSRFLQLLRSFVKFVRQVSGYMQLLPSLGNFVRQVNSFVITPVICKVCQASKQFSVNCTKKTLPQITGITAEDWLPA
jgi:hypothetical protein